MRKFRIVIVNTQKGFCWGSRRFILRRLRGALRSVNADIAFPYQ
jgi:endonuclease/exonuclease/phosphatase family metal-dependent hydrolase